MAKQAFKVDNGIEPTVNNVGDIGAASNRFSNLYISNDADIDGDADVAGTLTAPGFEGGGGGGGTDLTTVLTYTVVFG
jgi:hypothetical protein